MMIWKTSGSFLRALAIWCGVALVAAILTALWVAPVDGRLQAALLLVGGPIGLYLDMTRAHALTSDQAVFLSVLGGVIAGPTAFAVATRNEWLASYAAAHWVLVTCGIYTALSI